MSLSACRQSSRVTGSVPQLRSGVAILRPLTIGPARSADHALKVAGTDISSLDYGPIGSRSVRHCRCIRLRVRLCDEHLVAFAAALCGSSRPEWLSEQLKSCGANDHLRRVAGAQPSSTLFDKEAATYVVTTSERRQRALHDMPFGVVTATRVSANFAPEAGGFFAIGRWPAWAGVNVASPLRRVPTRGDNAVRPPPPVGGEPPGANGDEPSTINRCPVATSRVARGSPPSRRAMPSVRIRPSSGWSYGAGMRRGH